MKERTRIFKIVGAPSLFLVMFLFQTLTIGINNWTPSFMSQAILLDIFILIGIYAFRGFDYDKSVSLNSCLVSFFTGTIAGTLVSFIPLLIFYQVRLPQLVFIITLLISSILNSILFCLSMKIMIKSIPVKKFLIIGKKDEIEPIMKEIEQKSMGKVKAYMYMNPSAVALEREIAQERAFDQILIADPVLEKTVEPILNKARRQGIDIDYLPNVVESYLQRIPIPVAVKFKEYYQIIFDNIRETPTKRIIDVFISTLALIVLSPFMLIVALWILIEDGTPVIFRQERVGKDGKPFIMNKFRSMRNCKKDEGAKFATDEQHRIMKIGRITRPIRLDETPQFWDILIGKMSFIGPRPEQVKFVEEYNEKIPFYSERHRLKTGLTGWAQITYQYAASAEQTTRKLSYDLYYIKNRSTLFDLRIILQTVEAVVLRKGAK